MIINGYEIVDGGAHKYGLLLDGMWIATFRTHDLAVRFAHSITPDAPYQWEDVTNHRMMTGDTIREHLNFIEEKENDLLLDAAF